MPKSWRGRIPESWLEDADRARRDAGMSMKALGEAVAKSVGRDKPVAASAINDFLKGRIGSDDIALGISRVLGLAMPPVSGRDPDVQEWCDLGARLADVSHELFQRELEALREFVRAAEKYARRHP